MVCRLRTVGGYPSAIPGFWGAPRSHSQSILSNRRDGPSGYHPPVFQIQKLDWLPLTCFRAVGSPSDAELSESLDHMTTALRDDLRRGVKHVIIIDMLRAAPLSAAQRREASAWMKINMELFSTASLGSVFAIESPLVRGVLTALLWFQPIKTPNETVGNMDAAVRWALAQLERHNIAVPERAHRELGRIFASL